jgi:hypothetical protein
MEICDEWVSESGRGVEKQRCRKVQKSAEEFRLVQRSEKECRGVQRRGRKGREGDKAAQEKHSVR